MTVVAKHKRQSRQKNQGHEMEKQVKTNDKSSRLAVISSHLVTPQIPMAAASEKEAALAAVPSDSPTMYFPCLLLSLLFFLIFVFGIRFLVCIIFLLFTNNVICLIN